MVRAPKSLREAAAGYVPVLVTDMSDVDIEVLRFDFDLTLAMLLMHPDGKVYHRYGSRPHDDASAWTSIDGLCALLSATREEHAAYDARRGDAKLTKWRRARDHPAVARLTAGQKPGSCIHCHSIHDALARDAMSSGKWRDEQKWIYPDPSRVGLHMDASLQNRVREVLPDSPAARADIQVGDFVLGAGDRDRVLTIADLCEVLHRTDAGATRLPLSVRRGDVTRTLEIELTAGWRHCPPREYAWRPFQWNLSPAPGFGGPALTIAEKRRLSIPTESFAFRVQYLVDWGERAHRGRAARAAGIQKGDVILAFAGRSDFTSPEHFHAFVRLTRRAGEEVEVRLLRDGERLTLRYRLPE